MKGTNLGDLVRAGGDVDNRVKVLFDALRITAAKCEMEDYPNPSADEDPFFCLLKEKPNYGINPMHR